MRPSPRKADEVVVSIKAFDHNLACRGFQFEVGKTYKVEGNIVPCQNGFHAVDVSNPFYAWDFYPVVNDEGRLTRYAEVEQSGAIERQDDEHKRGSKIASAEITIKAELSLPDFIKRAVNAVIELTKGKNDKDVIGSSGYSARIGSSGDSAQIGSSGYSARIGSSGDSAQIGSSGDSARIGSSGDSAQIGSSGYSAQIGSSGDYARIGNSGDHAQIGSSGDHAQIGNSGDHAQIGSSGDHAQIGSSGDHARIGNSGDHARIVAEGKDAVIASAGYGAIVTGADGTWISVAEYNKDGKCVGFATGCIGKDGLKANTAYRAEGGKLVEVAS